MPSSRAFRKDKRWLGCTAADLSRKGASRIVSEYLQGHISVKYCFNKGRKLQLKRVGVDVVQLVEAAL